MPLEEIGTGPFGFTVLMSEIVRVGVILSTSGKTDFKIYWIYGKTVQYIRVCTEPFSQKGFQLQTDILVFSL
jgi:hypothetical protein